ncbi:sorting nexin MVP1 [Cryptococcus bacillisporus CA1873]|uniref:Sorting nexin MVP1 n=1 Tax=Cryptococcus bacillisporus CA1873 TaxID=1296111 RepID=A0ABR5B3R3_CRYGA|nr:sorting nexin MVP1 [Cryptococcus bacillisporus CA1873]|eukprot:KIR58232.1 sorting nexin MVP1 [Cryptococcus gattii CA1873]
MFNSPRPMASSYNYTDPLSNSTAAGAVFGELDPWSSAPSPAGSATPARTTASVSGGRNGTEDGSKEEGLNGLINDPPALYVSLLDQLDANGTGEVSLASVHRLLNTSKLPAVVVEKIIHLTSRDKSTLTRPEFFCALALVSLAQSSSNPNDISIEKLSSSLSNLPLPKLKPSDPPSVLSGVAANTSAATGFNAWDGTINKGTTYSADSSTFRSTDPMVNSGENGWWKDKERIVVTLLPEKEGWFLQKYRIESDKRGEGPVARRYSDFVWLMDVLEKRYPFRILPPLPPKRINPSSAFLEARRLALTRLLSFLTAHPVLRTDACLNIFLTSSSFESWRKRTPVSTDEESLSKKLTTAQEMSIPSDLELKLGNLKERLPAMLGHYTRLVVMAERSLVRLQVQAAEAARMAMSTQSIGELVPRCCWRNVQGDDAENVGGVARECELCEGVGKGWGDVGNGWVSVGEELEKGVQLLQKHIEALKSQRDLYSSFHALFYRHSRLSLDNVDALRKKVDSRFSKIESLKSAKKPGWEGEVDKLVSQSDRDTAEIQHLLARRVFVRACMWHELSVVFHSMQAAQGTIGWRDFVKDQKERTKRLNSVWQGLEETLEIMPLE